MRRSLITVGALLAFAVLAPRAPAQSTGGARGKVVDQEGQPLAGATVAIEYLEGVTRKYEVQTNDRGEYIQVGLTPGTYRITASKEGYQGKGLETRINLGGMTEIEPLELMTAEAAAAQVGPGEQEIREKFSEGVEFLRAGELDQAEAVFKELLDMQPGIPEAYRNLGYIYAQQKDWAKAEAAYQAALDLRPGDPDLMASMARVYKASGQTEKAKALLQQAAADNPDDAAAQFNEAILLLSEGQNEEAISAFEATLAADPSMAEAHYYLGTLLIGQGKVPEAIEHLEAYLASNPENEQYAATAKGLLEALKQ
jgi:tetratricopeptide (TPR) repeat protein